MDQPHISIQFEIKTLRFIFSMIHSSNNTVNYLARLALHNANTPLGAKCAHLRYKYGISFVGSISDSVRCIHLHNVNNNCNELCIINNLKTLIECQNNISVIEGFDTEEIVSIINSIAID
jgi:hypothetical protein